jgi:Na+-transporting NADH:ubiquinone oxidoreductase subunit NqrF
MPVISIQGLASGRIQGLTYEESELEENLLSWLRSRGVTIASSCDGEGVCKKCSIQNDWLTCELTLKSFLERQQDGKILVSYL